MGGCQGTKKRFHDSRAWATNETTLTPSTNRIQRGRVVPFPDDHSPATPTLLYDIEHFRCYGVDVNHKEATLQAVNKKKANLGVTTASN